MPEKKIKYLSKEWADEVMKRCKKTLTPEKMKHITSSMLTINTKCPDGKTRDVFYKLVDGGSRVGRHRGVYAAQSRVHHHCRLRYVRQDIPFGSQGKVCIDVR